ncbi:uncharacterized protein F13E9.13, mitochondrial isoform X1 [Musca domestica]|uniref:Uncharacterized protein F13E9.13, mitochondrial isoform X1 n=1 Tax=Musca domestica TaxID=7370 RepID=A0A9J7D8X1_MUSDO|nr:uncharacterized protein F13E9.13, mitochondrial isoform X1 [Musca domestica]
MRFARIFKNPKCNIIGMIHVDPLPGTPLYKGNWSEIIDKAKHEAYIYQKYKMDSILIENMHDIPYVQHQQLGPETTSCMTRVCQEVRNVISHKSKIPLGVQVLACGNKQALAIAKACDLQYIRAEGYVFGHVADEGYTDACAGEILRYRKHIDAENVLIFTDLKKKHSSHAITQDVTLLETAKAAEFFLTDGIVITGNSTGDAAKPQDFKDLQGKVNVPLLVGSGVTVNNINDYFEYINAAIIGSHFKRHGLWSNDLCEKTIEAFMSKVLELKQ